MLELSPTDDYAHYALGRALEKQGRDAEANGHYKLASSMEPGSAQYAARIRELDVTPRASRRPARRARAGDAGRRDRPGPLRPPRRRGRRRRGADADRLAGKVARLRIFEDDDGKFDRSLLDTGGAALVVSQFTLIADTAQGQPAELLGRRGPSRPSRSTSGFCAALRELGVAVETGVFGARMQLELVNDGPVTIVLE